MSGVKVACFVSMVGSYVVRAERAHWKQRGLFSRGVIDALEPVSLAYATGLDARGMHALLVEQTRALRARCVGASAAWEQGVLAVAADLELATTAWPSDPDFGVLDRASAVTFALALPHDPTPGDPVFSPPTSWGRARSGVAA
ncbi:hypothetical protein [Oerskovia flava]|uniref:hypothetical protein n=1 Tax=Oerskovia flava TaxID=2986422 RepID=UPI00223F280B|nr:hypothetical protein [Oerskovia sp. JB1-3-2]